RIAPGVEIVDCLAFNLPTALAVPERGDRRRRTQQEGILRHLPKKPRAERVTLDPGIEQGLACERRLGRGPFQKLLQDWTEIRLAVFEHWPQQHPARDDEKLPPQLPRFFESFRPETFHLKSSAAQGFCRSAHRRAGCRRDRRAAIV